MVQQGHWGARGGVPGQGGRETDVQAPSHTQALHAAQDQKGKGDRYTSYDYVRHRLACVADQVRIYVGCLFYPGFGWRKKFSYSFFRVLVKKLAYFFIKVDSR